MRKFLKINSSIKVRIGVKSIIVPVPKSSESRNKLSILDQVRLNNADWLIVDHLTTLTWKNLCITELSTKFIQIQGWLLLKFFICLCNQLSSFSWLSTSSICAIAVAINIKNF